MENKKLGGLLIVISVLLGIFVYNLIFNLNKTNTQLNCAPSTECINLVSYLNYSHIAVGLIFSILSLGVYLLLFSRSEEAIIKRLENDKKAKIRGDRFNLLLSAFDENEQNVLKAVKEQNGITQNTLRYRTNLSKSKISQILKDLELKNIIKREAKGKTYSVYLIKVL